MSDLTTYEGTYREAAPLAVREEPRAVETWTPRFAVTVDEAVAIVNQKREFMKRVMKPEVHYGIIPGAKKPSLWKPGAELLLSSMGLNPEYSNESEPILDVDGRDHGGEPFIHYQRTCRVYRQTGPGEGDRFKVAQAAGTCSSWEVKYRYRDAKRTCPSCGQQAIIKGKDEYGGGWICFKKQDGCGAKFRDGDAAIEGQASGKTANPDIADLVNTILKMADKRALVAATLAATGCSDIFTQDMESATGEPPPDAPPRTPPPERVSEHAGPTKAETTAKKVEELQARWAATFDRRRWDEGATAPEDAFRAQFAGKSLAEIRAAIEALERGENADGSEPEPPPETRATVTERPRAGHLRPIDDVVARAKANAIPAWMTDAQRGLLFATMGEAGFSNDEARHALYEKVAGVRRTADLDRAGFDRVLAHCNSILDARPA